MKKISLFISVLFVVNYFITSLKAQTDLTSFFSPIAEIYKGDIEEAADYIAIFPTESEADQILANLKSISEEKRAILFGEIPPNPDRIREFEYYVLDVFRKTEILQWCLLQMSESQSVSLLPGEGITLTLHSYCLDHQAASPDPEEFYFIDSIEDDQGEWLIPLLDFVSEQSNRDLPVQGLIWNMNNEVAYSDLPSDQQQLLVQAIPDAEKIYSKDIIDEGLEEVLDLFGEKVKEEVEPVSEIEDVIDNISEIEAELESRVSELKLVLPQYDTYQLENGLLIRAESTGHYSSIILTIVNPRVKDVGLNSLQKNYTKLASNNKNLKNVGIEKPFSMYSLASKFNLKDWKERLKKAENLTEKCLDVKDKLQEIDDFIEDPDGYIKGRGFNEGLDFFKARVTGNKKAQEAFELFRDFNLEMKENQNKKSNRPKKPKLKPFSPSKYKFSPGRKDVQPLKPVFGCG